jgi:hypothetical protein
VIPLPYRIAALLLALAAAAGGAWWWGASKYRAGEAAGRAAERAIWDAATAEQGRRFGLAVAEYAELESEAEQQLAPIRAQRPRAAAAAEEVYRADPDARAWRDQPIPDRLRAEAGRVLGLPADPGDPAAGLF